MSGFGRCIFIWPLLLAALVGTPAWGQGGPQNLDAGKSAAQLFASDCGICHKTPQGLARSGGIFGLEGFLREHYTVSRESASLLAKYLSSMGDAPKPAQVRVKRSPKVDAKTDAKIKTGEGTDKKPAAGSAEPSKNSAKPEQKKPADADKPAESKSTESKSAEPKVAEPKPAEAKPADAKPE